MGVQLIVRSARGNAAGSGFAYAFDQGRVLVGRGAGSDVRIPHPTVSLEHAMFQQQGSRWIVEDKGSTNGTWVSGVRLAPGRPKVIDSGAEVRLGSFVIHFHAATAVIESTSAEQTAELARKMLREVLHRDSQPDVAKIIVLNGPEQGRELAVPAPPSRVVAGRGEHCALRLSDAEMSREHFELVVDAEGILLRDIGSKNTTLVNGRPASERRLRHRDEIQVGSTLLVFEDPSEAILDRVSAVPDEPLAMEAEDAAPAMATPIASATNSRADEASAGKTQASNSPRAPKPRLQGDLVVYALAALVLAISVAGLVFLFAD